jgi:hypothetical protein
MTCTVQIDKYIWSVPEFVLCATALYVVEAVLTFAETDETSFGYSDVAYMGTVEGLKHPGQI